MNDSQNETQTNCHKRLDHRLLGEPGREVDQIQRLRLADAWMRSESTEHTSLANVANGRPHGSHCERIAAAAAATVEVVVGKWITRCRVFALHCLVCLSPFLFLHVSASSTRLQVSSTLSSSRACSARTIIIIICCKQKERNERGSRRKKTRGTRRKKTRVTRGKKTKGTK